MKDIHFVKEKKMTLILSLSGQLKKKTLMPFADSLKKKRFSVT